MKATAKAGNRTATKRSKSTKQGGQGARNVVSGFSRTRKAAFDRQTTETQIRGELTVDGGGRYDVSTGIRFFDHMLELFARHGGFDLTL